MDYGFNGFLVDTLQYFFKTNDLFHIIYSNRIPALLLLYIFGLFIVSLLGFLQADKLLYSTGEMLKNIDSHNGEENIPDELKNFSEGLSEFRREIFENEQARKTAEQQKNDLIVYLAHDLKTPLTSVIGYLSLLVEAPELPAEQRAKFSGIALDKAYRLEQLINEFFDITRLNLQTVTANKSPFDLTVMLLQIEAEFFPMLEEKGIEIQTDLQPEIKINGDADYLARVFDNLFRNAVNYSYKNSCMTLRAFSKDGRAFISLKNQSDIIPPEKLSRIFDKFYRLDSSRQSGTGGSGLGLAIAKEIVEQHGGSITAASDASGTAFTVVLPLL